VSEANNCDNALTEVEALGNRSPFLPRWPNQIRSALVGLAFAVVPALAILGTHVTRLNNGIAALFGWGLATILTCIAAHLIYKRLCTPPLRRWDTTDGRPQLRRVYTQLEKAGWIACATPSGLLLLDKILTALTALKLK
jgi:hypothetical protein